VSSVRALVTGVGGQDGSYLAELLVQRGYEVYGVLRNAPTTPLAHLESIRDRLELIAADVRDPRALEAAVQTSRPQEIYHLAAPSFVPDSWTDPAATMGAIAGPTAALLEIVGRRCPDTRVYVAASSEIFGGAGRSPQDESTPCHPTNPYGVAKLAAHLMVAVWREQRGLYACSGITYNHESPRRQERFVSRKVTRAVAAISLGLESEVVLGDLDAVRDWSFAGDVAQAAWLALRPDQAGDYVIASGTGRTVRQLVQTAFAHAGLNAEEHVRIDVGLVRPPELVAPVGDPRRAHSALGWAPSVSFEAMIGAMVDADRVRLAS